MKKSISLFLSALLALSLLATGMTSCDKDKILGGKDDTPGQVTTDNGNTLNGKSPEDAYNDALEKFNSIKNYEMTAVQDIKMTMTYQGENMTQEQKQTINQKLNGDDQYVKVSGSALEQETWYVDGVLYTISGGTKAKATLSLKEFTEKMMGASSNNILNIPESWFKDVAFKTVEGKKVLEFKVDGNEYLTLIGNALGSMGTSVEDMNLSMVTYTVYFTDDGDIEKITSVFSSTFSLQGIEVKADYNTVTTVSLGTAAEITAPADGDSFIDVTEQMKDQLNNQTGDQH